jgi:hypothetical protein
MLKPYVMQRPNANLSKENVSPDSRTNPECQAYESKKILLQVLS